MPNLPVLQTESANFSYKSTRERFDDYQLHCHGFYELYYFISGDIQYMVEGVRYEPLPGSILLLKPGAVHGVQNRSDTLYSRYTFHFTPALIPAENRELLLSPFHQEQIYFPGVTLGAAFDSVLEAWTLPKSLRTLALTCRFQALLTGLFPLLREQVIPQDSLTSRITAYINEHLREDLRLQDIAAAFFISKSQLNRIFKKELDSTVGGYIGLKRCAMARQLMLQGETAAEAAAACGFQDYSTFFRTYKRYMGLAPTQSLALPATGLLL